MTADPPSRAMPPAASTAPAPEPSPPRATDGAGRPVRSAVPVGLGTFLVLAACALLLVIAAGDRAPLWMIGAWFVLALAAALLVGAIVPGAHVPGTGDRREDEPERAAQDADSRGGAPDVH